jgi:hypothetical protein
VGGWVGGFQAGRLHVGLAVLHGCCSAACALQGCLDSCSMAAGTWAGTLLAHARLLRTLQHGSWRLGCVLSSAAAPPGLLCCAPPQECVCVAQVCGDGDAAPLHQPRPQHLGPRRWGREQRGQGCWLGCWVAPAMLRSCGVQCRCLFASASLTDHHPALPPSVLLLSLPLPHLRSLAAAAHRPAMVQVRSHGGDAGQCGGGAPDL